MDLNSAHRSEKLNPYGLKGDSERVSGIPNYITGMPIGIVQLLATFASVLTAVTLFQQRNSAAASNLSNKRTVGAIKVLLTNVPSLLFGLLFGIATFMLFLGRQENGELSSEKEGWAVFMVTMMFPLLSSVWNPTVFIALTPKSRKTLRCLFLARNPQVRPQVD